MQCMILVRLANKLPNRRRSLWFLSFYKLGATVHWRLKTDCCSTSTHRERTLHYSATPSKELSTQSSTVLLFVGESARALMRWSQSHSSIRKWSPPRSPLSSRGGLAPWSIPSRDLIPPRTSYRPRDESFPPMLSPRSSLHCDRANYPSPKYVIRAA